MVNTLDIVLSRYKLKEKKDKTNYLLVFFLNLEKWGHLATDK